MNNTLTDTRAEVGAAPGPAAGPPLAVAVAGAGYIAGYHLGVLKRLPGVNIVGACDPNDKRLEALCGQWGIPRSFASLQALLSDCKPDVVHVLVPPQYHFQVAASALSAGSHVLLEKPMALSADDCDRLLELARSNRVVVGVNHNFLHHPAYLRLKRDMVAGKLGKLEHVVSINNLPLAQLEAGEHDHWMFRTPTNILFEQGPHPFSQVCDLLGEVKEQKVVPGHPRRLRGGAAFFRDWQFSARCARGSAQVLLSFAGGFPRASLEVIGQDGLATVDLWNNSYVLDRRTKYLEPVDRLLRGLGKAGQTAAKGVGGFSRYALSTLRLINPSDPFYVSMQGSIESFYASLKPADEPRHKGLPDETLDRARQDSAENGLLVTRALEDAARSLEAEKLPGAALAAGAGHDSECRTGDVLVLGSTGFIGSRMVPALVEAGHHVRLMVRRPALVPDTFRKLPVGVCQGDVRNAEDVAKAVRGCAAVIHLVTGSPATWSEFEQLFIAGTRNVAQACLQEDVKQLLFASSIAVYYLGSGGEMITEQTPLDPHPERRTYYTRAKIACEELLLDMRKMRGLPVTIFRPGVVVGAGGLVEHSGAGYWPCRTHCISWGRRTAGPLPFVLVDDVAKAFVKAIGNPAAMGQSFNLVGDVRLSAEEYIDAIRRFSRRDIRLHRQSILKWWTIDFLKWIIKAVARKPDNAFPSYRDLASRSLASPFDCRRAKEVLGWQPMADRQQFLDVGIRHPLAEMDGG